MTPIVLVLTTVAQREDAAALARAALDARLAACVQAQPIESWYEWQGAPQHDSEWRLLFKTTASQRDALVALLRERHPYELPALLSVDAQAEAAFGDWVGQQTQRGAAGG